MNLEDLCSDSPNMSVNRKADNEDGGAVLPGFRFHPTDEELVGFYLRKKMEKKPLSIELIKQVDIYKYDPWDLPMSKVGDTEWYFFCIRGRKYRNSIRPNRVTGSGFWKATGIDKPIYSSNNHHDCIGLKKSLVYYRGHAGKGTKTDWMMHEFRLPLASSKAAITNNASTNDNVVVYDTEVWTICRILRRIPSHRKYMPTMRVPSHRKYMPTVKEGNNVVCSVKGNNSADSSSKMSSLDSGRTEQCLSFGDSSKRVLDERSYAFTNPPTSSFSLQEPLFTTGIYSSYPPAISFWTNNVNGEEDFVNIRSWDELRSVVDRALDPSFSYKSR